MTTPIVLLCPLLHLLHGGAEAGIVTIRVKVNILKEENYESRRHYTSATTKENKPSQAHWRNEDAALASDLRHPPLSAPPQRRRASDAAGIGTYPIGAGQTV